MRFLILALLLFANSIAGAATNYFQEPAAPITRLLTTSPPPTPLVHARSGHLALLQEEQVISMERLHTPRLGLAGLRLDPVTRITGIEPMIQRVDIVDTRAGRQQNLQHWVAGEKARFEFVQFSPDGQKLSALKVQTGQPSQLWLYDIPSGQARMLSDTINPAWGKPYRWLDDNGLLCRMRAENGRSLPQPVSGPVGMQHSGKPMPTRTYTNLLETPFDDAQFEYYFSVDLARVDIDGHAQRLPIEGGLITRVAAAPDGNHILIRRLIPPFSRLVPARRFPGVVEVWNIATGERLYQSSPMGFGVESPVSDTADPASITWAPYLPVTAGYIYPVENADGSTEYQWRTLQAPFNQVEQKILARSPRPIRRFGWTSGNTPWYVETYSSGTCVDIKVILSDGEKTLWSGDPSDRYENNGTAIKLDGDSGPVLEVNGAIFISGTGLSSEGIRPYLDRINLKTHAKKRLFLAEEGVHETVLAVLDPVAEIFLTSRETETTPPSFFRVQPGRRTTLFATPNPYPQLDNVERKLISYFRADGVKLSATLYVPPRENKKPLPTLIWIYPREFNDPDQAEQLDTKPFQFHRIKGPSPIAAVLAGYAVLVNPTMPIILDDNSEYEQYLPQLVLSADAAVDYLIKSGISDPARIAIGGRSYGAFSAANLLIHSNRFAAGIAMSGAYNRTLTPFGFQHEKRSFWAATDYYTDISPFFQANLIKLPLLLVHGGADSNPGTPRIQTRRFFHALVGEGATVRYAELPGEEHHYRGRDTVLQAAWEMIDWLDCYLGRN